MKESDAYDHRSHCADAGPYRIDRADRKPLRRLRHKIHTQAQRSTESDPPPGQPWPSSRLRFPQAKSEAHLHQAGQNQNNPAHIVSNLFLEGCGNSRRLLPGRSKVTTFIVYSFIILQQ